MVAQLPIELLQIIFRDATPEDLRQYRLVDHQWSAASTPYVFERFHASLFSRSMTKLSALSQSPLAKHVKLLYFHTDQLPGYSKEGWEAEIDHRPHILSYRASVDNTADEPQYLSLYNKLPKHKLSPAEIESGWQTFQSYSSEQRQWNNGETLRDLKTCLGRLQNLHEVVADRAKPFSDGPINNQPYWRNFMSEILVGPDAWTYEQCRADDLEALSTLLLVTAIGHRSTVAGNKAVEKLALDLPTEYSFHDMLHVPAHYPKLRIRAYPQAEGPDAQYEVLLGAFRPLKHLTFRCPTVEEPQSPHGKSQMREAERILAAASSLQSLNFDFGEPGRCYEGPAELEDRFDYGLVPLLLRKDTTYQHLTELKISAGFPSKPFRSFLLLHKKTLKRLDIRDCFCEDWGLILETIAKDLDLEHVYVESLWSPELEEDDMGAEPELLLGEGLDADDEFSRDMKAFLYTGEGLMPVMDDYEMSEFDSEDEEITEEMLDEMDSWEYEGESQLADIE